MSHMQPHLIHLYNKGMGGVDRMDRLLSGVLLLAGGPKQKVVLATLCHCHQHKAYSTVGCRRTVCRRTARLEFHLKIRTTPGWKNELRAVYSFCCEDDFFNGIANFETTPRRHFEIFQPH